MGGEGSKGVKERWWRVGVEGSKGVKERWWRVGVERKGVKE